MNCNATWECIIGVGTKVLGGLAGSVTIIIVVAKFLGAKWIDVLIEKCLIKYKHKYDTDLAYKNAQYNTLLPEQKKIAKELYCKILKLQQSTKLTVELFNVAKEQINESPNDIIDEKEEIKFEFTAVCVNKENRPKTGRVFSFEEIVTAGDYEQLQNEVKEYIEQKAIFIPEGITSSINAVLFLIERFMHLNFPKEFIQYSVQDVLDIESRQTFANQFEEFKKSVDFDDSKVIDIIDGLFTVIQNQFRLLLGVENK